MSEKACDKCGCPMYHNAKTGWYCPECSCAAKDIELERLRKKTKWFDRIYKIATIIDLRHKKGFNVE